MISNKLKINLFGEIWKLKQLIIPKKFMEVIENYAITKSQSITDVIADPFFYHKLQNKKVQSVEDWDGNYIEGLLNTPKNNIEIWYKNKKVQKLKINDLNNDLLLFPLYNASLRESNSNLEKGIYIEQKEIGMVGSFNVSTDSFILDDLAFQLLKTNHTVLLESLAYKNQTLYSKNKDALITFQNCFEIK
nr:hypothetical protein [uncultured Flavobacterium sp.]